MKFDAIIVGAGISGLVAAHRLKKLGRELLLIESGDRVGGVIQSENIEGFLIERGPNSLRGTHELLDLVEELNMGNELVAANPRAPAFVYANGDLHAVPMSPPALIKTGLISNSAKLRLLREPFIKTRNEIGEESVASFVRRRLGDEILDRLVAPFLSGVYAGNPEQLSVQACFPKLAEFEAVSGSILRGGFRSARAKKDKSRRSLRPYRLCSFRSGLQALPKALARPLGESLLTEARVATIEPTAPGFSVAFDHRNERKTVESQTLIVATPSFAAAQLLAQCAPDVSALLSEIPYVSIVSVPIAYPANRVSRKLDGFGFLAPRDAGLRTLGSIWNSSLFADRAPGGWVCTTNFIGGATDPEAFDLGDDELVRIVHGELREVLSILGEPRRLPITRYERAIPQYNLGHAARIEKIEKALHHRRGLWIAGNYLRGVSLGDCIGQAERIAIEIDRQIKAVK